MTTRFSLLLLALLLLPVVSHAQSLLLDNFNYTPGTALTANGWTAISAAGTNPVTVTAANLTQPNYPGASGNAAVVGPTGEDVSRAFTAPVTSGTVYAAALVSVTAAQTSGDYFFHFSQNASTLVGRVFARATTGGFQFGISKTGTFPTAAFGTTTYDLGTPYLVVLKYEFIGTTGTDDPVSLFVFAPGDTYTTEPATPIASFLTGNDLASANGLNLRQGGNTVAPTLTIDGIRVGASWNEAVLATQTVEDGAGYRLLGAPVGDVTVGTLAGINLVQGVTGQYPLAGTNLFLGTTGAGTSSSYIAATDVTNPVLPGIGFLWYLYDRDITPTGQGGGGTSVSYTVPERQLFASGPVLTTDLAVGFPLHTDGFYLIANPFAQALAGAGVTQTGGGGTFSNTLQLFDGTGFVPRDRTVSGFELSMWQGAFAEVQGGTAPQFTYVAASRTDGLTPLVSRTAATELALTLAGTTSAGTTRDAAAIVRFDAAASVGWDAGDASKLTPPTPVHALIAPVGDFFGTPRRQAVLSLPAPVDVALAFMTTHAGSFTLTAEATGLPGDATVRDIVTGNSARLADGLPFTADATEWTERFVVSFGRTTAGEQAPAGFSLGQVFPNPAVASARVALRVDAAQTVSATVVDALGRTVSTVFEGALSAGQSQDIAVDTATLAPGVYVVRIAGETFSATRRLVVAR